MVGETHTYHSVTLLYRLPALTHATLENWQFNDVIRRAADSRCAEYLEKATDVIDDILYTGHNKRRFKDLFGLADLKHDDDFASLIIVCLLLSLNVFN